MTRSRPGRAPGFLASLLAALLPGALTAQNQADTVSYRNQAQVVFLELSLDLIGLQPGPGADLADIQDYVTSQGWVVESQLTAGAVIAGLPASVVSRQVLFDLGRSAYEDRPDLFENGGPVAHVLGTLEPTLVLTDQFIVRFEAGTSQAQIDLLVAAWQVELLETASTEPELRLYRVTRDTPGDMLAAAEAFNLSPLTRWAYPDFLEGTVDAAAANPHYGKQWHLENAAGADINVLPAWAKTKGEKDVVIAVLETWGFDVGHPDLTPNLWRNEPEINGDGGGITGDDEDSNGYEDDHHGWNFLTCTNTTLPCGNTDLESTYQSHGTAVAGLIAAKDNNIGVAGVCPDCSIMLLAVGGQQFRKELAFRYARDNGAHVINASWVMNRQTPLEDIIREVAVGSADVAGIPIVWAMGNSSEDVCVNGAGTIWKFVSMPEVLAVGSSNDQDKRVANSNFGDCIDLMAPGGFGSDDVGVTTTDDRNTGGYNPDLGCTRGEIAGTQDYTNCFGGTSASTAIVSGVIGLMLSANPALTRTEVFDILFRTAVKIECAPMEPNPALYGGGVGCPASGLTHSDTHGYGRVDAGAAVEEAERRATVAATYRPKAELGARIGWTDISGGSDHSVYNAPGSGPAGEPVLHFDLFSGGPPNGQPQWMWELQVGWDRRTQKSPPQDETLIVAAFQPNYLFAGARWYVGVSLAWEYVDVGGGSSTDNAAGIAVGRRFSFYSRGSARIEARFRHWANRKWDELGLALGFGVMFP